MLERCETVYGISKLNNHRGIIKNVLQFADLLYRVVGKNKFQWTDKQQQTFDNLKDALSSPLVLALPNTHFSARLASFDM